MNDQHDGSGVAILGPKGQPTKIKLRVQMSPGPLQTPVAFPPVNTDEGAVISAIGGATRMETIASRLLAGAMAHNTLERCGHDPAYRQALVDAAVLTAWDLVGAATTFRGPAPVDPPTDDPEKARDGDSREPAAAEAPDRDSPIVVP